LLCGLAGSAAAQIGAMSPSKETDRFRAPNAQIECGPIGCRPLPSGCRQVSLGGRWIDNNGRRVVCDNKKKLVETYRAAVKRWPGAKAHAAGTGRG